jgi:hypothetical protein
MQSTLIIYHIFRKLFIKIKYRAVELKKLATARLNSEFLTEVRLQCSVRRSRESRNEVLKFELLALFHLSKHLRL